jgi:hypothetical protein
VSKGNRVIAGELLMLALLVCVKGWSEQRLFRAEQLLRASRHVALAR